MVDDPHTVREFTVTVGLISEIDCRTVGEYTTKVTLLCMVRGDGVRRVSLTSTVVTRSRYERRGNPRFHTVGNLP